MERACPLVLRNSFKDIYRKGTVGTINRLISDGSLKNPRTVCESSSSSLQKHNQGKLSQQLESNYKSVPQLHEYTQKCADKVAELIDSEFQKVDRGLALSYMQYDFNYKSLALQTAMKNLLDSNSQIGLILPSGNIICQEIRLEPAQSHCRQLQQCKPRGDKQHYLNVKSEEVTQAINALSVLSVEHNKIMTSIPRGDMKRAKQIKEDMGSIMDLNPLLKGEKFKSILQNMRSRSFVNQTTAPKKTEVDTAIKEQLKISQAEISKQLKEFNNAYGCLIGEQKECRDFKKIMGKINYQHPNATVPRATELNEVANFHSCVENVKDSRDKADVVLNDVGINLALTLTPYAIVNGVKLAGTLGRTAIITSRVTKAENLVTKVGLGANIAYGGYHSMEEFMQCQEEVKRFQNMGASPGKMTCESMEKIFVNNSNNSRCINQALLSAAFMTPVAAKSLSLARHLPKIPANKIRELTGKIRSGQSLTKAEETLLLAKLKERNPLNKLMLPGISNADKQFASQALEKLYKQENLSPEDLLKLSKLIKPRNPPLLIVTRQDDVDKILDSKRIWGRTEGSVYGATKPAETAVDKLRTGVHGDKEGTFIFTPEAAALFKPHEITGLYSAIKRGAGQYKGPFGDIIIEDARRVMVNGRPHIIVTKARRASGTGSEVLHQGQKTSEAQARLLGRRAGLDTIANTTGAIVTIQAASVFTGVSVSDILYEVLEDD